MKDDEEIKQRTIRLSDKQIHEFEEDQKQRGGEFTLQKYLDDSLKHYLKCRNVEDSQAMKLIIARFDGSCLKCHHKIEAGSYCLWSRGVGLICLDCHIERTGDRTTIAKYLRNRELDKVKRALTVECDALADKVEVFRTIEKVETLSQRQDAIGALIGKYLKEKLGTREEVETFLEIKDQKKEIDRLIDEVRQFIEKYMRLKKWIRRKQVEEEAQ